ncbi:MAG: metal ABC transporter substrate-binding protein, partial [Planctomycetota bacterium]
EPGARTEKLYVVTTLGVLGDLAQTLGGDRVEVEVLADPRQDPHFVSPRPTLMKRARRADVFIEVGLGLELWAEKVVSGSGNARIQSGQPGRVIASDGVSTLELPRVLSREWGDVHPYGNPHIWLDPLNTKIMAANISQALTAVDGAHAQEYEQNLVAFQQHIDEALFGAKLVEQVGGKKLGRLARAGRLLKYLEDRDLAASLGGWLAKAQPLRGRPIVTYHKTYAYLADRFGFTIPLEIEEKPGIPPSARQRDHVLEVMRKDSVRTILLEIFYDRRIADYLAEKTGATVAVVPIDVGQEVDAENYFDLIDLMLDSALEAESQGRH